MNITIDGKQMTLDEGFKNIVDLAAANGIGIPAPCYHNNRQFGCCNGCVINVDGNLKYACTTKPVPGMAIAVNNPELIKIRRDNLKKYKEAIEKGEKLPCDCGDCSDEPDGCGCGCGDGCC
ncbi:MAG: 2Fe-2S iron-sulfur cluster-binding protein [Clostridia bacterium]|nr:2Fe-2S iron-sulfur cluster-binding protein [Clostridia bacterium]